MDLSGRPHEESCLLYSGMNGSEGRRSLADQTFKPLIAPCLIPLFQCQRMGIGSDFVRGFSQPLLLGQGGN